MVATALDPVQCSETRRDLFTEASDYLIKQQRHLGQHAILARCIQHLESLDASREDAETAAVQAYAALASFNSRHRIDVDKTTSSVVWVDIAGTPGKIALTVDSIVHLWRNHHGLQVEPVRL